jgi:hypothetical protein
MTNRRDTLIAILFGIAFLVAGALTYSGKVPVAFAFAPVLTGFLGWIVARPTWAEPAVPETAPKPPPPAVPPVVGGLVLLLVILAASLLPGTVKLRATVDELPGASAVAVGCSPADNRLIVNSVLDIVQMACVLYEAEAGKPEAAILTICRINEILAPEVHKLISAQAGAKAKKAADDAASKASGASDAGRDAK